MSEGYNGWANYETWVTNLWISNDQATYNEMTEAVRLVIDRVAADEYPMTRDQLRRFEVAEGTKRWVEDDLLPDLGATLAADLLSTALSEVDWYEIADAWLDDVTDGDYIGRPARS